MKDEHKEVIRLILGIVVAFGLTALLFLAAFNFTQSAVHPPTNTDLTSLLFSASTLALLSLFLAVTAVFGWRALRQYIQRTVEQEVGNLHDEHVAGLKLTAGALWGRAARIFIHGLQREKYDNCFSVDPISANRSNKCKH